jgi:hypothetical protein
MAAKTKTKTVDSKGRISLGSRFAGQTVLIEEVDRSEVRVTLAQVIPQRELWLQKNKKAKAAVLRGLAQARGRRRARSSPDLDQDARLVEQLDD